MSATQMDAKIATLIAQNLFTHAAVQGNRWYLLRHYPMSFALFDPSGYLAVDDLGHQHLVLAEGIGDPPETLRDAESGIYRFEDGSEKLAWHRETLMSTDELASLLEKDADEMYWATMGTEDLARAGFSCAPWWKEE